MKAIIKFQIDTVLNTLNGDSITHIYDEWSEENRGYYGTSCGSRFHKESNLYCGYTQSCNNKDLASYVKTIFNIDISQFTNFGCWLTSAGNFTGMGHNDNKVIILLNGRRHGVRKPFYHLKDLSTFEYLDTQMPEAHPYMTREDYENSLSQMVISKNSINNNIKRNLQKNIESIASGKFSYVWKNWQFPEDSTEGYCNYRRCIDNIDHTITDYYSMVVPEILDDKMHLDIEFREPYINDETTNEQKREFVWYCYNNKDTKDMYGEHLDKYAELYSRITTDWVCYPIVINELFGELGFVPNVRKPTLKRLAKIYLNDKELHEAIVSCKGNVKKLYAVGVDSFLANEIASIYKQSDL